ncbi:MAG TPA: (d)CMP kinase [Mycobacteriales bacterium]|nr:(d)CMP kinase [Mycobacteriales bacterium]
MTGATRAIALDGPSGSGKSTVARRVARTLGWRYVDTGATYRAVTLAALRSGVALDDAAAVVEVARGSRIAQVTDPDASATTLDGTDVSEALRGADVTASVSAVSAVPEVRRLLVALQRELAGTGGAVVEGRDIAAVVLPDARVKVYLDASPEERARRRAADADAGVALPSGGTALQEAVAADLARRDALDSGRATSPLAVAPGAVVLDSSAMDADAVVERVLELARQAGLVDGAAR